MFNLYFESEDIEEVVEFKLEALDDIKEALEAGYVGNIYDLHREVFDVYPYVDGRDEAKDILFNKLNTFHVIDGIVQYEEENFGKIITDFSEPEVVLSTFYYLIGENCIQLINNDSGLQDSEIENDDNRVLLLNEIDEIEKRLS